MSQPIEITPEEVQKIIATGKQYCVYFYKTGPNFTQPEDVAKKLQMEHLQYLFGLRAQGKLVINGPVMSDGDLLGVGIFNTPNVDEVKEYLNGDPAVKAGRLVYEIHPWFSIPGDSLP